MFQIILDVLNYSIKLCYKSLKNVPDHSRILKEMLSSFILILDCQTILKSGVQSKP